MSKQQLDARMGYAESVLATPPKTGTTIAVDSILADYEADEREEILESIQAYADIRARQAIFAIYDARATEKVADVAPVADRDAKRYTVQKNSGSLMARVIDTVSGMTIKSYDVMKRDGWNRADKHADALNKAAEK